MNDLIKKGLFIAAVILAWDNRHVITSFIGQCWNQGITVAM